MSKPELSCGLEYSITSDIQASLSEALINNYSFVIFPIIHPRFKRVYSAGKSNVGEFTRSDMLLSPHDWTVRVVGKLSPYLNVDVPSLIAQRQQEDCMSEELAYCRGLGLPAIMLNLHGKHTVNLARLLQAHFNNCQHPSLLWVRVPMLCKKTQRNISLNPEAIQDDQTAYNETWLWWTKFHERMEWDKRIGLVLEISADLPNYSILERWFGEPIKAIILPTSIFQINKRGYPCLSFAHQKVVFSMIEREAQVIITGARRFNIEIYTRYLNCLKNRCRPNTEDPMLIYAKGWEDYLQTPLQPLADNLDTHTYNIFEKDPVKYSQYQKAIAHALEDLKMKEINSKMSTIVINEDSLKDKIENSDETMGANGDTKYMECQRVFTVMVLGAGRGPLVRATLNAADITKTKVKVIAVEKNPCAVVVLSAHVRETWRSHDVRVVPGDMRCLTLEPRADIVVSELLGSWGDNELSPECLDGAFPLLAPNGLSIPTAYTSYAAPITSPRLWAAARAVSSKGANNSESSNLETLWVVYMQNKYDIAEAKPVFTFDHPATPATDNEGNDIKDYRGLPVIDNRRRSVVSWVAEQDSMMHGFGGYFDCLLYGKEILSIVPSTHSPGMISWFPVFIPIKTPMRVSKGDKITATFWRCVSSRKVWYEWVVEVGNRISPLHNSNGKSSEMLL